MRASRVRPILAPAVVVVMALFVVATPAPAQDYWATPDRVFHTPREGVAHDGGRTRVEARGGGSLPAPLNSLEDCWTTSLLLDPDVERELYEYTTADAVYFIWKQKLLVPCSAYRFKIIGTECTDGKPPLFTTPRTFQFDDISFGAISPVPGIPELLFAYGATPGTIPPGRHDWMLLVECDDTTGFVRPDGDIEDVCGLNKGFAAGGPLILGPEPIQFGDADPGGSPPGRGPGEEGTTRPWCFEMLPDDPG